MSKNKYLLILVLLGLIGLAYAQHPDTAWVRTYNGPDNYDDYANAIAVDGDGNVYVTGASATIADWPYNSDYATIKYYPDGTIAWTSRYNGPENGNDEAKAIALRSDTVYVTGHSYSDATFDNYCTIKYLPNGDTAWVRTYNGPGNYEDWATAIAVDGSGNVYVTGNSRTGGYDDYLTIKYVQTGAIQENRGPLTTNYTSLDIFPNPAKTFFNVRSTLNTQGSKLRIFDVSGKEIRSLKFDVASAPSTLRVPLNGIKNGVYFVKVGDEMIKEKLVVTR